MNDEPKKPELPYGNDTLAPNNEALSDAVVELEKEPQPHFASSDVIYSPFDTTGSHNSSKNSKEKIILILVAIIVLVGASSAAAFALWYSNPDKAVSDAVVNVVSSRTYISDGNYEFKNDDNKGRVSLSFDSKTDTPNFKGQLDARLKVDYEKYKFDLAGSGLLSENGTLYFKFDGVKETLNKYIEEPEVKAYISQSPQLKKDILAFANKIDSQWIKLGGDVIAGIWSQYDHKKTKTCFTSAYNELGRESSQRDQVAQAYDKNRFIIIQDKGGASIGGIDSTEYNVTANVAKYYQASAAFEKTDFAKNLQKCGDQLTGEKQTDNESREDNKFREESAKDDQKEIDKAKLTVWVSRWGHEFTKTNFVYNDAKEKTRTTANINYKFNQKISAAEPKKSIPLQEFQSDIDKIQTSFTSNEAVSSSPAQTATNSIVSQLGSYRANNNGKVPTLLDVGSFASYVEATNKTNPLLLPSGYTIDFKNSPPPTPQAASTDKQIDIWPLARCDAANEKAISGGTTNQVAVVTMLENGKSFCLDN